MHRFSTSPFVLALLLTVPALGQEYNPKIKAASNEGEKAIHKFTYPADLKVSLWAAEPDLANPVAFCHDVQGRIYVAETFRLHKGVTDNRSHRNWLDEELACRTVEDRVAMYKRKFANKIDDWQSEHERIRLLEDTDGDGKADRSVVYADGFKELPDGIAAGLLAHQGKVWFTCIPKLWILEDKDGDGRADERKAVQDGYGVHTSLLGHDLHGLRIGPDGKLYFSIGDRGFHVVTPQRTLSFPDEGAVLRCNLDGTDLEVVHRGLRNPQELAFDNFGNLFTGDNNSDGGDKARWVYVVEGGHSGWHIGYQSIGGRGPWNKEKLWHPHWRGQAAYIVPPITNIANGPSGLTFDPGIGLPARYRNKFFLCEFRGGSGNSGILAIGLSPKGASFELTDEERFLWNVLPTDVDFGYDGGLYISDWTEGWGQPLKGRIYRIGVPGIEKDPKVVGTRARLNHPLVVTSPAELFEYMTAHDRRLRQHGQFELVRRKNHELLFEAARQREHRLARLHGIWGIGQLGRKDSSLPPKLLDLLKDPDHEIRAQVAKVMGQTRCKDAVKPLIKCMADRSSRVRFFAAISLGQLGDASAIKPLVEMIRADDERDPYLRHASVMGLSGIGDLDALARYARDRSRAVRIAMVLVHRRHKSPAVARFLSDSDPLVVLEAARAIHDVPIVAAMPKLAEVLNRSGLTDPHLLTRAVNANYRVGDADCIARLTECIRSPKARQETRVDAVKAANHWENPSGRDRVINLWRPLPKRSAAPMLASLAPHLGGLLKTAPDRVCTELLQLVDGHALRDLGAELVHVVESAKRPGKLRSRALELLDRFGHDQVARCAKLAANNASTDLRKLGVRILSRLDPASAVPVLQKLIATASKTERQNAMSTLGTLDTAAADRAIEDWLDQLSKDKVDRSLRLELLDAAAARKSQGVVDRLKRFETQRTKLAATDILRIHDECLEGGDKERGKKLFWRDNAAISCQRCHRIGTRGGEAGPDLSGVGIRLTREEILGSMLDPNRKISEGFKTIIFTLSDDSVVAGIVKSESAAEVHLIDADGKHVKVDKKRVTERLDGVSSMPPLAGILKKNELRDLVEFLSSQQVKDKKPTGGKPRSGQDK